MRVETKHAVSTIAHTRIKRIERTDSARTPEVLAPGAHEQVAADFFHVHRHLPNALARVEEVWYPVLLCHGADRRGGVDEAATGGHVGDGDELHGTFRVILDHPFELRRVELPALVARDELHDRARTFTGLEVGDGVAGVLGSSGEDAIALCELETSKRRLPHGRGALPDGNLGRLAVEQVGDGVIRAHEVL